MPGGSPTSRNGPRRNLPRRSLNLGGGQGTDPLVVACWTRTFLVLDEDRSFVAGAESDVSAGAMVYRCLLEAMSDRSGGYLRIQNVEEDWGTVPGYVLVTFELNGER